jgi:hypothetical protein
VLQDISLLWALLHTLVLFLLLLEPRYSVKKTRIICIATMLPLLVVYAIITITMDTKSLGLPLAVLFSLPSLILFWIFAKNRDGRFFFTFCLVDTITLEIVYLTQILNSFISPHTHLFLFISRLIIPLLLEWVIYRYLRDGYIETQKHTKNGWSYAATVTAIFFVLITLTMTYPTVITDRPDQLPAAILLLILVPIIYLHLLATLHRQHKTYEMAEQKNLLALQVSNLTSRMTEYSAADERFRIERHNFRHKLKTIASLIKTEQYEECLTLLSEYEEALDKTRIKRYCQHTVLDAVLSSYIKKAQDKGIALNMGFAFPDVIPMSETELATAIANALENALNACEAVEPDKRFIEIKVLSHPRFMIRIANSYVGEIEFDENEIPINRHEDHGFGTRFIAAFCHKNGGFYQFRADGECFTLYLNF